jgi:hypothetical protein
VAGGGGLPACHGGRPSQNRTNAAEDRGEWRSEAEEAIPNGFSTRNSRNAMVNKFVRLDQPWESLQGIVLTKTTSAAASSY